MKQLIFKKLSSGKSEKTEKGMAKASDTQESFLSKVAFESDFRKKTCTCHENIRNFSSFKRNFHN